MEKESRELKIMKSSDIMVSEAGGDLMEDFRQVDREALEARMAAELQEIRRTIGVSAGTVASKIGMGQKRYAGVENGRLPLRWCEYMSLVFLFWNNEISRTILEEKGLFPDAVKKTLSINRNAHAPASALEKEVD